jgi:DNA-binding Lrp family transcriptional regulator
MIEKSKIKILLIEDNPADVRLIELLLKKSEDLLFELDSHSRLSEGLKTLKNKVFDIILLDLALPDSDREATIEEVLSIIPQLPIIILTGLDDKDYALNSLKKGFQDYLVKGELDAAVLTRAILYAIERHKVESDKDKVKEQGEIALLDEKDKIILNILQNRYKISYKELSEKMNLAASTIHNRVQKMVIEGIIKEIDTIVDPSKVGYKTIAIVGLNVDPLYLTTIAKKLTKFNEIQLVATSTGKQDIILKVIAESEKDLWRFINENIKAISGIKSQIDVSSFIDIYKMSEKVTFKLEKE